MVLEVLLRRAGYMVAYKLQGPETDQGWTPEPENLEGDPKKDIQIEYWGPLVFF